MDYNEKFWNDWLDKNKSIITYNDDGSIDVNGDISINFNNLTKIIPKFNKVNGCVDFSNNRLKSLKNSPKIVNGFFNCGNNNLNNFKYSPIEVNGGGVILKGLSDLCYTGTFYGYFNLLKSFEGLNVDGIKNNIYLTINGIPINTNKQIIKTIQNNDIKWLLLNNKNYNLSGYEIISQYLKGKLFC